MACFLVPTTEAIVTTIATKIIEKKEKEAVSTELEQGVELSSLHRERFSVKLNRLNHLLWGGSLLLAFEHFWHGEIQPFFPFLTAAGNPADWAEALHEMSTVGVGMAVLVTCVWGVHTWVLDRIAQREGMAQHEEQARRAIRK
ncbi:MAG: hypothetical protein IJ747_00855 [Lachnospiraceae bacterium]|nr:hypothetical protein [Lachnospiraceae bacterium]